LTTVPGQIEFLPKAWLMFSTMFNIIYDLRNKCSLLGIVMGITVESQTIAALVNISKYSKKSAFEHCSRADRIPTKGITNLQHNVLLHIRP
jgi:uncharacterized protein with NRDE domain